MVWRHCYKPQCLCVYFFRAALNLFQWQTMLSDIAFDLLKIELEKIFKKGRSFIGFIAIGILVPIIQIAMYSEGNDYFNMFTQTLQQQFDFSGNLLNGYLIAFIVLQSLFVHIPLLVSLIAGDMLAGEAIAGTFRILLIRPVSRFQVISAKFIPLISRRFNSSRLKCKPAVGAATDPSSFA